MPERAGPAARGLARDRVFVGLSLCLLVSGASALIYEIAWVRSLELVFGATSFAIATVLAAFMGGLALGSRLMGAAAGRLERHHPLRIYAVIEALIGVCGLLVPAALRALVPVYRWVWQEFQASFGVFSLWRFLLCAAILLVPTALMGATLPIASRLAPGRRVGLLYAVNTLGAVLGCALAGLALLPSLGLRHTEWLAVLLNFAAAGVALTLERRVPAKHAPARRGADDAPGRPVTSRDAWTLIALYAISGVVAMMLEVSWSRLLVLVLGSSTYSYTTMLTTFLAGLAIGAALGARYLKDRIDAVPAAALCQLFVALTTYFGLFLTRQLPYLYVLAHNALQPSPRGLLGVQLVLASGLMLLPTLGLGAMFPIVMGGLQPAGRTAPRVVGRAYAWNTAGAIVGSVAAGFWLVPRRGSRDTLVVVVTMGALLGLLALRQGARRAPALRLRAILAAAVVVFLVNLALAAPVLPPEILSSGAFRYADRYRGLGPSEFAERAKVSHGDIEMFREGLTCTVTVFRTTAARTLLINGKPEASAPPGLPDPTVRHVPERTGDLSTQILVAHLPLLLAPRPADRVLVIGLGSGITLGSALTHPVKGVECVELEDAVVRASRLFDGDSGAPLEDPRVRLVVNDARNHLLLGGASYDVIVSEPSNPWVAGAASLFTQDFFRIARSRLSPGGRFAQWMQLYEMQPEDFRSILRSFLSVFPDAHLFRVASDAILVGSDGTDPIRLEAIADRFAGPAARDLARLGIAGPRDLLAHLWIGGAELRDAIGAEGPLNTDDNMRIEFSAPLRMLSRRPEVQARQTEELSSMFAGKTSGLLAQAPPPGAFPPRAAAAAWAAAGDATLRRGYPDLALVYAQRSLAERRNATAARVVGDSLAGLGRADAAREWLAVAGRDFPGDAGILKSLVELERAAMDWKGVRRDARSLLAIAPDDRRARYCEGESLYRLGEMDAARATLAALAPSPDARAGRPSAMDSGTAADLPPGHDPAAESPELGLFLGALQARAGRPAAAVGPLRDYLARRPGDRQARALLAEVLKKTGRDREALAEMRRLDPDAARQASLRLSEAIARWTSGPRETSRDLLEAAREYDPDADPVVFLLARARARCGDRGGAVTLLEEFLDAHPDRPWAVGYLAQLAGAEGETRRALVLAQRYRTLTGRSWNSIFDDEAGG